MTIISSLSISLFLRLIIQSTGLAILTTVGCSSGDSNNKTDSNPAILTEVIQVEELSLIASPKYTFNTTEAGVISVGGNCESDDSIAIAGDNTITFSNLDNMTYSNCVISVTDNAGNESEFLLVSEFTVDTTIHVTNSRYIKLDQSGLPLLEQNKKWVTEGNELTFDKWSCVLDNETSLVWEVKSDDGGLRHKSWRYTWYNTDVNVNGGEHGVGDLGEGVTTGFESNSYNQIYAGSDNCADASRCDTEKYVLDVNQATLCGASDWALPPREELQSLLTPYCGPSCEPTIEEDYFPNVNVVDNVSAALMFWADAVNEYGMENYAWMVDLRHGSSSWWYKSHDNYIRLFRNSP